MSHYLIEFRFSGYAKRYLKQIIFEVAKKFRVRGNIKRRVVPHVTLFGPFTTTDESKVVSTFLAVCRRHPLINFKIKGFGNFDKKVIFINIIPSEELKKFRIELSKELTKLSKFLIFKIVKTEGISDYEENYPFHATIAFKDIQHKFDSIFHYLKNKNIPQINQKLLRVTLLKNGRILYEYDFVQRKLLTREEALNRDVWRKTIELLNNGRYTQKIKYPCRCPE